MEVVYAMHKRFRDLRSFLFIDGVVEADTSLRKGSVSEAVKTAITEGLRSQNRTRSRVIVPLQGFQITAKPLKLFLKILAMF